MARDDRVTLIKGVTHDTNHMFHKCLREKNNKLSDIVAEIFSLFM